MMIFHKQDRQCHVILSEAKDLKIGNEMLRRSFASLRMTLPVLVVKLHYRA
jgi:hypothetical protein